MDPTINQALYDAATGYLKFNSNNQLTANFLGAELIHLYQSAVYGQSQMASYASTAKGNIEFEAQLLC